MLKPSVLLRLRSVEIKLPGWPVSSKVTQSDAAVQVTWQLGVRNLGNSPIQILHFPYFLLGTLGAPSSKIQQRPWKTLNSTFVMIDFSKFSRSYDTFPRRRLLHKDYWSTPLQILCVSRRAELPEVNIPPKDRRVEARHVFFGESLPVQIPRESTRSRGVLLTKRHARKGEILFLYLTTERSLSK